MDEVKKTEACREEILNCLHQILRKEFQLGFEVLKDLDIHPGQVAAILLLEGSPGISQAQLAERLLVKPSTISVALKRMEARNLLVRQADPRDLRHTRIFLTEKGKLAALQIKKGKEQVAEKMFCGFSEEEYQSLKHGLQKMKENMEKG